MSAPALLRLSCPQCAAAVEPTDGELRRHCVACGACGAVLGLGPSGLLPAAQAVPEARPPEGAYADRRDGKLFISAPRLSSVLAINKRELKMGFVAGLSTVFLGMVFVPSLPGSAVFLVGGISGVFLSAKLRKMLAPIEVDEDVVKAGTGFGEPIPRRQIRQIYATKTSISVHGQSRGDWASVFALTNDGKRVHLLGPVQNLETALWIEGVLETHLGLQEVEVHGQSSRSGDAPLAPGASSPAPRLTAFEAPCESCGALNAIGSASQLRGLHLCGHCGSVTRVSLQSGPLGSGTAPSSPFEFEVQTTPGGIRISKAGTTALEIDGESMRLQNGTVVRTSPYDRLSVRPESSGSLVDIVKNLGNRMAYSGNADLSSPEVMFGPEGRFLVELRSGETSTPLLSGVRSAHEALSLRAQMAPYLRSA